MCTTNTIERRKLQLSKIFFHTINNTEHGKRKMLFNEKEEKKNRKKYKISEQGTSYIRSLDLSLCVYRMKPKPNRKVKTLFTPNSTSLHNPARYNIKTRTILKCFYFLCVSKSVFLHKLLLCHAGAFVVFLVPKKKTEPTWETRNNFMSFSSYVLCIFARASRRCLRCVEDTKQSIAKALAE